MIKMAKELVQIPIYVLIRPRAGDFFYNESEIEVMKEDILFCVDNQIDGVVFGILNREQKVDEKLTSDLMKTAGFMDVTFHKAFDEIANQLEALDTLRELGVQRILTSGGKGKAYENIKQLEVLIDEAADEVVIMPGGGIRPENVKSIIQTGCKELHSSCMLDGCKHSNFEVIRQMKDLIHEVHP
jgi:copper homeostasis protein